MRKPSTIRVPAPSATSAPVESIAHALAPLAKLCLRSGLGAGDLVTALKKAFVRAAAEEVLSTGRLNYSRIAAISGLTRKEVKQLLEAPITEGREGQLSLSRQRTARVIQGWRTDPLYQDDLGAPAVLPISGTAVSFHSLVKRYGGDVTPISVLKELERTGSIRRLETGSLSLRKVNVRRRGYNNEALVDACLRLHDLGVSFIKGLETPDAPVFNGYQELKVDSPDSAALFQTTFTERGASLLSGVERWAASQAQLRMGGVRAKGQKTRVGIGVYLVNEKGTDVVQTGQKKEQSLKKRNKPTVDSR